MRNSDVGCLRQHSFRKTFNNFIEFVYSGQIRVSIEYFIFIEENLNKRPFLNQGSSE